MKLIIEKKNLKLMLHVLLIYLYELSINYRFIIKAIAYLVDIVSSSNINFLDC